MVKFRPFNIFYVKLCDASQGCLSLKDKITYIKDKTQSYGVKSTTLSIEILLK